MAIDKDIISGIKDAVQSCNVSFLVGSGISNPYLITLGGIEKLLTEIADDQEFDENSKNIIMLSLYKNYFEGVMLRNCDAFLTKDENKDAYNKVLNNYRIFLNAINCVLLHRDNVLLNKQINLFTTNIDVFFERALVKKNVMRNI
ncbi:MAG: hypothetical protein ABIN18_24620 [Pseudomonadota bacterium]